MGELAAVAVVVEKATSVAACREVATLGQRLAAITPDALEAPEVRLVFAVIDDRVFAAALLATRGIVQPLVDVGFPTAVAGIAASRAEDEQAMVVAAVMGPAMLAARAMDGATLRR
jgi:hypothetical protein